MMLSVACVGLLKLSKSVIPAHLILLQKVFLPVCIGKATRLIEYLNDDKEYLATVQLGKKYNNL